MDEANMSETKQEQAPQPVPVRRKPINWNRISPEQVLSATAQEMRDQERVKILIPSTETQRDDVTVQINGYCFQIKRDQWVEVPKAVIEVLNNCIVKLYSQRRRPDGEGNELVEHKALRFPYQRVAGE